MFDLKVFATALVVLGAIVFVIPKAFAWRGWDVDAKSIISASFDDNVTLAKTNKKKDLVTSALVGLSLRQEGKRHSLGISGNITQQIFSDNNDFNNTVEDMAVDFQKELSKHDQLSVINTFRHAQEPRSFEDAFGRTTGRYSYYRNNFDLKYFKDLTSRLTVMSRYGHELYAISREDISDSILHRPGVELNFTADSDTVYLIGYDYQDRTFDSGGKSFIHTVMVGLRRFLTKQLSVEMRGGSSLTESAHNGHRTTKPSVQVQLNDNINDKTSVSMGYRKENMPNAFTQDVFDLWQLALNIKRQIFKRLAFVLTSFYGEGEFHSLQIHERLNGVSGRFNYEARENLQIFLEYSHARADSNDDAREYNRNLVSLGVTFNF